MLCFGLLNYFAHGIGAQSDMGSQSLIYFVKEVNQQPAIGAIRVDNDVRLKVAAKAQLDIRMCLQPGFFLRREGYHRLGSCVLCAYRIST